MKTLLTLLLLIPSLSWGNDDWIEAGTQEHKKLYKEFSKITYELSVEKYWNFWGLKKRCDRMDFIYKEIKLGRYLYGSTKKNYEDIYRNVINRHDRCKPVREKEKEKKEKEKKKQQEKKMKDKENTYKENEKIDKNRQRFTNKCFRDNLKDGLSDKAVNMLMYTCIEDAEAKYPYKN